MLRRAETCPRRVLGAGTRLGSVQKAGAREQKSEAQARRLESVQGRSRARSADGSRSPQPSASELGALQAEVSVSGADAAAFRRGGVRAFVRPRPVLLRPT